MLKPAAPVEAAALQRILNAVPLLVASCDRQGRYMHMNAAYAARFGKTPEELIGSQMIDIVGPRIFAEIRPLIERVLTGERVESEITLTCPGIGAQTFRSVLTPIRDSGTVIGWDDVGENVTVRRRAESRLRSALDASETGTCRWDMLTDSYEGDENVHRLLGVTSATAPRSIEELLALVHPHDRERIRAAAARCQQEGADFEEEFRVVWPDGSVHWIYDKGRTYASEGTPAYMTGAWVDVTERRQTEDALREADRQKDEFLGMLAHELRNPLAPLVYAVTALERRLLDPATKRPLEIMRRQVTRISRLVDDLLDISRVTQGKITLQRRRLDMGDVLRDALEVFRPVARQRRHEVDVELADDVLVSGDAQRLGQVFENLLGNALKYTPDGGQISVRLSREPDSAVVTIRDTGVGIEPEMLPRVFELFVQAETSLDRSQGGLGIGLTLVDRLTRLHGGSVSASSPGLTHGSEFMVRLPLLGHLAEPTLPAPVEGSHATGARRILIVDDNPDIGETLADLLEMNGHVVRVINDARTAVAAAEAFMPNVMLLDIGLPGLSGYEIVRAIRRSASLARIPVVAVTGYGGQQDAEVSQAAGFTHHLTKPVSIDDLERIIASCAPQA